ncbi:putative nuclease HARBI1 [Heptranchias perlo]|uniref:putative nuclease HARBI1 n=1 Tax=Heptranchias perlo TaxID=212740 RepID=UPI003559CA3F
MAVKVTTAFSFFASGSFQGATGDRVRVSQLAAHQCIRQGMDGLFARAERYVNSPCDDNSQNERALGFASLAVFPKVQGAVDSTHVAIRGTPDQPGAIINRKGFHSINVQLMCKHKKRFLQVCTRFPGSCHDAFILRQSNIPNLFVSGTGLKQWVLGDKGYPLQTWLMTPLRNPTNEPQECSNDSHLTTGCVIEQTISTLKMRCRCLGRSGGAFSTRQRGSLGLLWCAVFCQWRGGR